MSEELAAVAAPIVQAAVKALTPEAEAVVKEVHDLALNEFAKLEEAFPRLVQTAKTDAAGVVAEATSHVEAIVNALRAKLGLAALGQEVTAAVGPTSAAPAPQA